MRLTVPPRLEVTLKAYAELHGTTPLEAGKQLLIELAAAFSMGVPGFLGPSWQVVKEERAAKPAASSETEPQLSEEQIRLIERSSKLASGFAGVYRQNSGWRAMGPDGKFLKQRPTALWAAWERHQAFSAIPKIDPVEESIAWLRTRNPRASEEELRREAEDLESLRNGPLPPGM